MRTFCIFMFVCSVLCILYCAYGFFVGNSLTSGLGLIAWIFNLSWTANKLFIKKQVA